MKILVLHAELGILRGGGENFTRNLFVEFSKRGHEVCAVFGADLDGSLFNPTAPLYSPDTNPRMVVNQPRPIGSFMDWSQYSASQLLSSGLGSHSGRRQLANNQVV